MVSLKPKRIAIASLMLASSCLEPFDPPRVGNSLGILVVDGFMDHVGNVSVRLSRANSLADDTAPPVEPGANISVEAIPGGSYSLQDAGNGNYSRAGGIPIGPGYKYKLHIRTKARDYISDIVSVKDTPFIDSIFWEPKPDGIEIYLATHDSNDQSRYYEWNFTETWRHYSYYVANFKLVTPTQISVLKDSERVNECWSSENSKGILISSTEAQGQDIIGKRLITFIPKESNKISSIGALYSILIQQRVIEKNTYTFLQQLQKTTESIGGLFDPLPSQVVGNVHRTTDSTEPVLGYFSAGTVTEKRIFIDPAKFPSYLKVNHTGDCPLNVPQPVTGLVYDQIYFISVAPTITSTPKCMNCTLTDNGTTTKPPFWP